MTSEPKLTAKALADKAAKEAATAKAKAELLERESAEASAKFQAQAEIRRQKFMNRWLDDEFVQAPEADVARQASTAALEAAVEEAAQTDPVLRAWLAYARSSIRSWQDGGTAQNFASQVGVPAPRYDTFATSTFFEVIQRVVERLASRREEERTADIFDALERAANGDDDGT